MPEEESCSVFNKGSAFNGSVPPPNTVVAPSINVAATPNSVVALSINAAATSNTAAPPNTAAPADPIADPPYTTAALSDPESFPSEDYSSEDGSDESTEDSVDSDESDFFGGHDYGSDVHEGYIEIRKESKPFQRRKRKEKAVVHTKDVPCGDAGPDIDFDEIEIVSNMSMLPESANPSVAPPVVKSMPGRPKKVRRKEANETKKSDKLPKTGLVMTCMVCHERGHNKRGCPKSDTLGASSSTAAAKPTVSGNGRGRPKKSTTNEGEPTVKRERAPDTATTTSATARGRGRGRRRGGRATTHHSLESWFSCSAPNAVDTVSAAPISFAAPSSSTATRGRGRAIGSSTPYKRPRLMGMGVFQAENGFTTINLGLPSSRIVSTRSSTKITRSADVTGDIGFKPTSGLKWKGKQAITTRRLQEFRDKSRNAGSQPQEP
ncbi:hypothetical protein A4A49_20176 [Nicotiana attenuata]|uniref:CCHC-type domain-containing protein n=1 Tax=Nicotiana attenuata TaxID=49451 RepID=A0A314KYJ6_NICAT|nr:hypothetical protein A4A49_20176 [Nicotiana attenuata]